MTNIILEHLLYTAVLLGAPVAGLIMSYVNWRRHLSSGQQPVYLTWSSYMDADQ